MAKKYLLYIHNGKFEKEKQKSDLVNLLLDRHYDYFKPGTLIEDISFNELFDASVVGNPETAEILKPVEPVMKAGRLCRHNFPPRFCKYAKPGKPCR